MTNKKKSRSNRSLQMQKRSSSNPAEVNLATGLRNDEVLVGVDPNASSKVTSYVMPDGRRLKPGDKSAPPGIPSIVHPDLLVIPNKTQGFRSTLASRLHEMLIIAEDLFGERDRSYSFLGIEFTEAYPHIYFEPQKNMIMRLHINALLEPLEAYAQMAHECIHMLSPNPLKPVTILEEGMAEVFSYIYMRDTWKFELRKKPYGSSYHEARELVGYIMGIDTFGIKQLRLEEPTISLISKSMIWNQYPMLYEGMAARLARTFVPDVCNDPRVIIAYQNES